jgi:hypothetical protein
MEKFHMQRMTFRRLHLALLATCVGLAMAGAASAQTTVTSPETGTVTGRQPVVATATITGTQATPGVWRAGDTLTAVYTITDPDNDVPDEAASDLTIQWLSDNAPVGAAGSKTYVLQASDVGKRITYRLVPKTDPSITDPFEGVLTLASNVGADGSGGTGGGDPNGGGGGGIDIAPANKLLSVAVSGNAVVSDVLTATPTCVSACAGDITYQWQLETAIGSGSFEDIADQTGNTYTPARTDQRRKVKVVATQP